jgi:hypothetical protein
MQGMTLIHPGSCTHPAALLSLNAYAEELDFVRRFIGPWIVSTPWA